MNAAQSTTVFRILQEALTNVMRHAQATAVSVILKEEAGEFILTIGDNGRGIREQEKSGWLSVGILGIEERAISLAGRLRLSAGKALEPR